MKKKIINKIFLFLTALAFITQYSYSWTGPYEPEKPEQLR